LIDKRGHHPNSRANLAKGLLYVVRCSRPQCNRPRFKQSPTGKCWRCWKKWESRKKCGNDPHNQDMARLRFYKERMGPKLNAFVEDCIAQSESDQFNLCEELAVQRDLLGEAIELYEKVKKLPDTNPNKANSLASVASILATATKEVRETCRVGAEVFNQSRDKLSVHALVEVVAQIKRCIRLCFDHDEYGLQRLDDMLSAQLRLPKIGTDGTTITPDQDVLQMDATVPSIPVEELLLQCPQCNQQFNHPDANCVCPECNCALLIVEEMVA